MHIFINIKVHTTLVFFGLPTLFLAPSCCFLSAFLRMGPKWNCLGICDCINMYLLRVVGTYYKALIGVTSSKHSICTNYNIHLLLQSLSMDIAVMVNFMNCIIYYYSVYHIQMLCNVVHFFAYIITHLLPSLPLNNTPCTLQQGHVKQ